VTHSDRASNLPTDADALRALVVSMSAELEAVTSERNALTAERDGLLERLERQQHLLLKLSRMQFGRKSERLPEGLRIPMKSAADSDRNWPPIPTEAGR
jgi:hypothetical protein